MTKTLALLVSGATVLSSLAIAPAANAQIRYYRGPPAYNYYAPPRRFHESPMYAPDAPANPHYNNPGIPDFQTGSRG